MKPRLYESTDKSFTSFGICSLPDAITCTVTEEINGAYELDMEYPITGTNYDQLYENRIICAQPAKEMDPQPFQITQITRPLNGKVSVHANHISYILGKTVSFYNAWATGTFNARSYWNGQRDFSVPRENLALFTFWTDKTNTIDYNPSQNPTSGIFDLGISMEGKSVREALMSTEQGGLLYLFGDGDYEWDKWAIKLHEQRGSDKGVAISYGKNLTALEKEIDLTSFYTGIMPIYRISSGQIWYSALFIGSGSDQAEIIYSSTASDYPYKMVTAVDFSDAFSKLAQQQGWEEGYEDRSISYPYIRTAAQNYINAKKIGVLPTSIKASFIPLTQVSVYKGLEYLQDVCLGDTVTVKYDALGVNNKLRVMKTVYNVLAEKYDSVELGKRKENMNDTIKEIVKRN